MDIQVAEISAAGGDASLGDVLPSSPIDLVSVEEYATPVSLDGVRLPLLSFGLNGGEREGSPLLTQFDGAMRMFGGIGFEVEDVERSLRLLEGGGGLRERIGGGKTCADAPPEPRTLVAVSSLGSALGGDVALTAISKRKESEGGI